MNNAHLDWMNCNSIRTILNNFLRLFKFKSTGVGPLADVRMVLTWLCLCPADKNTTKVERSTYYAFGSTIIVLDVYALITSVNFFRNFMHTDVGNCLYATAQIMGLLSNMYTMIVMFFARKELRGLFDGLSEIYRTSGWHTACGAFAWKILCLQNSIMSHEF